MNLLRWIGIALTAFGIIGFFTIAEKTVHKREVTLLSESAYLLNKDISY